MDTLETYFEKSTTTAPKKQLPAFRIAELYFEAATNAKFAHLINKPKTYAAHKAMEIFYDKVSELLDTYVETCAGIYTLSSLSISCEGIAPDLLSYFKGLYENTEKLRNNISDKFIQSEIDMLQQETAHCMYRLTHMIT